MAIKITEVTLSLDTNAYASGDVLADTQAVSRALTEAGESGRIRSVVLLDKDDQGIALDLLFLKNNVSIGTENAAVSVTDANADEIFGVIEVAGSDYVDLVGSQVVAKHGLDIPVEAEEDKLTFYVAAITRGTPTHTASGITLKIAVEV